MKKLTVVVGAGASCEFGLPTGSDLKSDIAKLLDIRYDYDRQESGDHQIAWALRRHCQVNQLSMQDLVHAGWHIRDALTQAISIDNFIDSQRDPRIEMMGKIAIVRAILQAEQRSSLHVEPRGERRTLQFSTTSSSWLNALFQLLTQNCVVDDLASRLGEIGFVIFNYDRCIEHYLLHAIENYYRIPQATAAEIIAHADFYHPYGTVGSLPWQHRPLAVEFGGQLDEIKLIEHAVRIQTFTEGTDPDDSQIAAIRNAIRTSERLLFLGFAYHKLNMELINPGTPADDGRRRRSFGTSYGMSNYDSNEIAEEIANMQGAELHDVHIRNDLKCGEIFKEFSRGISID